MIIHTLAPNKYKMEWGASCYFGLNKISDKQVFIKILLFPRSGFERSRFRQENYALEELGNFPVKTIRSILSKGNLYDDEVLYLITEKVEGLPLKQWITKKLSTAL